ncbi:MAG TPA: ATP-binding protein [Pyrinomonadaceae bacterium]|nr:ATP-binding protein [Pyrinomonadaceae bacterium]
MNFFNTFRGKLLVILAFLLIITLGIQFYLNYKTQEENNDLREMQEQAILSGIALAISGLTSQEYMKDIINREGQTYFDENFNVRIKDIIVINDEWQIWDSLNPDYLPTTGEDGKPVYLNLKDLKNLPPPTEGTRLGEDLKHFPNVNLPGSSSVKPQIVPPETNQGQEINSAEAIEIEGESHVIPIQTSEGRWYVMVVLRSEKGATAFRAAQPLIYTLAILLASTLITFYLVWRFTRPIANLSTAARRVAEGDLRVRVPESGRTDEMGRLTSQFNEMTAGLEKSRRLEAQLQEAEKSAVVGRLASAIAHEIRNPLNYINLTLDHLRSKFTPEEPEKQATFEKLTEQLKKEVERINRQVSDFLRYSRPLKLDMQPIEARRVVESSLRIIEPQAEEQNVKISLVERENVPNILGDPEVLRSVFSNLFINAVQAMENTGGNLSVTVSPDENVVKIEVADTGAGISEENLSKIFEPYFSTKETGTGLGLAIVRKIIEDHNGTIEVESKLNEGTKFSVRLPRV